MKGKIIEYVLPTLLALGMMLFWLRFANEAIWRIQAALALTCIAALIVTREKFKLTPFVYWIIWCLLAVFMIAAHDAGNVPPFIWLVHSLSEGRDHYDLVEYFMQGGALALLAREMLLRGRGMKRGTRLFLTAVTCSLAASIGIAGVQLALCLCLRPTAIEHLSTSPSDLGLDMLWVAAGAAAGLLTLSRLHDRDLRKIWKSKIGPVRWIDIIA